MKTNLKNNDSFTRSLDVIIAWADLKEDYIKEFNAQKKKFKIPGFRPGKVPNNIVKKEIGPAIEANFAEISLNRYYQEALMELKIVPINQAQISKLEFKEASDLKFTAIFEVIPGRTKRLALSALLASSWYFFISFPNIEEITDILK